MMHCDAFIFDTDETVDSSGARWRRIPGARRYYVSDRGDVKSFAGSKDGMILIPFPDSKGYNQVDVRDWDKTVAVHRLVAMAFIENPDNLTEVNHKDGVKTNNAAENLEWCDHEYNMTHASEHDLLAKGEERSNAVLDEKLVKKIYLDYRVNHTPISTLSEMYNINLSTIRAFIYKTSWRHVTDLLDAEYNLPSLKNDTTVFMTQDEASEIYLMYKLDKMSASDIHAEFDHLTLKAIQSVMYKETWTKVTDKLDKKFGFICEKKNVPMDQNLVRSIYLDLRVNGFTVRDIREKYGLAKGTVENILYKNRWKDFTDSLDEEFDIPPYVRKMNPPLDEDLVIECYKLMLSGQTPKQVSAMKDISCDVLRAIQHKRSWKKVTDRVDKQIRYGLI